MKTETPLLPRRLMLKMSSASLGASIIAPAAFSSAPENNPENKLTVSASDDQPMKLTGRVRQSVCRWCYAKIPMEEFARGVVNAGIKGIDLLPASEWEIARKYNLTPTMVSSAGTLPVGMNRKDLHEKFLKEFEENIPKAAAVGAPNVICFSGNRNGLSDGEGIENCAAILKRAAPIAEKHNITICMELLNSKVDHKDYQCDHTAWGVELVKAVNHPRFKLLYDIYHMQIMEGDVIRTIRDNFAHIAHYHTGGNPGRNEIDETQELYYPAIVRAIADLGFRGWMAHEFIPKRDPITSLRQAAKLCDV
jgi:hydroxypyruvate isomerase